MTWESNLELYDRIAAIAGIERKGKTVPYTSANGHMFSLLNKDGDLGFRYSKDVQEKYIDEWNTTTLKSHGATMRGYVQIPEDMWDDLDALADLLKESLDYVMSLEPK
jgi:TfoX/Sxy family transcriptional regulator of competence genes